MDKTKKKGLTDEDILRLYPYPYGGPCAMWYQVHDHKPPTIEEWIEYIRKEEE